MTIQLGNYFGAKNKITKSVSLGFNIEGTLRSDCDIMNPSILIEASPDTVCGYNYAYIPEFGRWYFVQNVNAYRTGLSIVSLAVDVLYTYKESILNSNAIVCRSSKTGDAIHELPDDRAAIKQSETTHMIQFDSLYDSDAQAGKGQTAILILTGIDHPASP